MVSPFEMLRPPTRDLFGGPVLAGRLEHDRPGWIRHQERVVVREPATFMTARSALAVALEQIDHDRDRSLGRRRTLQPQSQEVHAQQTRVRVRLVV